MLCIGFEGVFVTQSKIFEKAFRRPMDKHVITEVAEEIPDTKEDSVVAEEMQGFQKATFLLRLFQLS